MMDFDAYLRGLGLIPRTIAADGRWRRCPTTTHPGKKNGAYCLAPDGQVGWAQDWATMTDPVTWRPESAEAAPVLDYAAIRARREQAEAQQRAAIQGARDFYAGCSPLVGGHPYLKAHGLDMTGCRGLKVDRKGWLVVPMGAGGQLMSVQRISEDGDKRFWPGAPTKGARYTITRRGASLTVLCEGLATGLALYAAQPLASVVVAFNAGNLPRVAETLPRRGMACVAADNDHETESRIGTNPGVDYAREAAALLGCEVAIPTGMEGTDFCDLRQELVARAKEMVGQRNSSAQIRREVDAEMAAAMMRAARFLPTARVGA